MILMAKTACKNRNFNFFWLENMNIVVCILGLDMLTELLNVNLLHF
jgi:hypothetical protein